MQEVVWRFWDYVNEAEEINAATCAFALEDDDLYMIGPHNGYVVRLMEVQQEDEGITVNVYVERPLMVTGSIGWDGTVLSWT